MSRKTKAELEAENTALKAKYKALGVMYKALEKRFGQLEDEHQNLQGYVKLLHQMGDEDRRDLKITENAHQDTIDKAIVYMNQTGRKLKKNLKGQETKAKTEAARREFFRKRYLIHLPGSKNKKDACRKADKDTCKKFPKMKPYTPGSWYEVIKGLPKP